MLRGAQRAGGWGKEPRAVTVALANVLLMNFRAEWTQHNGYSVEISCRSYNLLWERRLVYFMPSLFYCQAAPQQHQQGAWTGDCSATEVKFQLTCVCGSIRGRLSMRNNRGQLRTASTGWQEHETSLPRTFSLFRFVILPKFTVPTKCCLQYWSSGRRTACVCVGVCACAVWETGPWIDKLWVGCICQMHPLAQKPSWKKQQMLRSSCKMIRSLVFVYGQCFGFSTINPHRLWTGITDCGLSSVRE